MMTDGIDSKIISQFKKTIDEMVQDGIKKQRITNYITAKVSKVNQDGTFDVYFPPDVNSIKTGLLNKSHDTLLVGDTVEVCTKNGSLANAWIALRHGPSDTGGGGGGGGVESITVGTTTTLPSGSNATVINSGSNTNMVLNFGIPMGPQGIQGVRGEPGQDGTDGVDGRSATIQVGNVTSGTTASVTNVGTDLNAVFDFVLPNGDATRWYVGSGTPSGGNYTPGDMYLDNTNGDLYYFNDVGQWILQINIKGPKGDDGIGFRVIGVV